MADNEIIKIDQYGGVHLTATPKDRGYIKNWDTLTQHQKLDAIARRLGMIG